IVTGACEYGLDINTVTTRVLKWTYGVLVSKLWKTGDPLSRKDSNSRIDKFLLLARKGTKVNVNEEFSERLDQSVLIILRFASMENTVATAKSEHSGEVYRTVFTNKE
ncbi:25837_t:CDS:2, partial [Gigaspora margarita]